MDPSLGVRIDSTDPKPTESRFTSRKDMILAVHQALNSSVGQAKLRDLDTNPGQNFAKFVAPLVPPVENIERFRSATDASPQTGLRARAIFVYVSRIPGRPGALHLQTAFPRDVVA